MKKFRNRKNDIFNVDSRLEYRKIHVLRPEKILGAAYEFLKYINFFCLRWVEIIQGKNMAP